MANLYLSSSAVKMFPSSKRSDSYDRNARLNSEQNLVSIINRLTNKNSFIIDGLTISGTNLTAGKCNIYGYLFELVEDLDITGITVEDDAYLCFKIKTVTYNGFTELVANDYSNASGDGAALLDGESGNIDKFYGLQLVVVKKDEFSPYIYPSGSSNTTECDWYLPIAESISENWTTIISDDNMQGNRWNTLVLDASNIKIQANDNNVANNNYNKPQDLSTWLQNNFIIDDGEIEAD